MSGAKPGGLAVELKLLAHQYRRAQQYWAREMAQELLRPLYVSKVVGLRSMCLGQQPVSPATMLPYLLAAIPSLAQVKNRQDQAGKVLHQLEEIGLIRLLYQKRQTPFYTLTDLGETVLGWLPETIQTMGADARATPKQPGQRYDWATLDPQADRLEQEGKTSAEIAREL